MKTQEQKDFEAKKRKLIRQERKELGVCVSCGKPLNKYNTYCDRCTEMRKKCNEAYLERRGKKEYYKEKYAKQKAQGLCTSCGHRKVWDGLTTCMECTLKRRRRDEKKSREKKVMPIGLRGNGEYCSICIKPVEIKGEKLCNRCKQLSTEKLVKAREARHKHEIKGDIVNGLL